jgi:tRNA (cmo5U34)-methyltransferase
LPNETESADRDLVSDHQWHSPAYVDAWISSDVTRDDERRPLLRRVATLIAQKVGQPLQVLDVGGGYGAMTAEVLDQHPSARVVLHDYSEAMITKARDRLARFGQRVSYVISDLTDPSWHDNLGGPFDAVVSVLAIHNLNEVEIVKRVYREIFALLRPGGYLFNLDFLFPESPELADLYRRDPTRDPRWDVYVYPAGLESHLRWLREAGFRESDCVWKNLELGLIWAMRTE